MGCDCSLDIGEHSHGSYGWDEWWEIEDIHYGAAVQDAINDICKITGRTEDQILSFVAKLVKNEAKVKGVKREHMLLDITEAFHRLAGWGQESCPLGPEDCDGCYLLE